MEILNNALSIALVVFSVLMIVVVLLQKSKGSGLGSAFGGESPSFSPRAKTATREAKLQKVTVVLAIIMGILAIAILIVSQFVAKADGTQVTSFLR